MPPNDSDSCTLSDDARTTSIVDLPLNLAEKIVRTFPRIADGIAERPAEFELPSGIVAEVQSAAAFAFSHASQTAKEEDGKEPGLPNPNITLYCPHNDCHEVIDSVVELLAQQNNADVVVVDSLELALGKYGIFGEGMEQVLEMLYKSGDDPWNVHSEAQRIQAFIDAVVNIERGDTQHPGAEETKYRIIYFRDFGAIVKLAAPLMFYFLKALRARRTSRTREGSGCEAILPTILIMGFSHEPPTPNSSENMSRILNMGGKVLREILPSIGTQSQRSREGDANSFMNNFIAHVLLPTISPQSSSGPEEFLSKLQQLDSMMGDMLSGLRRSRDSTRRRPEPHKDSVQEMIFPELELSAACLCVFPKDAHTPKFQEFQRLLSNKRRIIVWNAWITMLIEHRRGTVGGDPLGSLLGTISDHSVGVKPLQALSTRSKVPLSEMLDCILSSAVKLATTEAKSLKSSETVFVSPEHLRVSYESYVGACADRTDWVKDSKLAESGDSDSAEDRDDDDEHKGHPIDPIVRHVKQSELDKHERQLIDNVVDFTSVTTSFGDVCIPPSVIESLRTIISLPLLHPAAFKTGILRHEGIGGVLLYGPPGTGKTMACRALAQECQARMLQIKPSDVMDKYVGETEKLVRAIFNLAYRLAPCVIFIDEIDALFRSRTREDSTWRRDMLNEFMQAMDGLQSAKKNKDAGIIVVGATNRPYDLDDAILRRLPTRMMVDLPGPEERERILRVHLADENLHRDLDITTISLKATNYSGSDLRNLCVSAAMASVKEMIGDIQWGRPKARIDTPGPQALQIPDWNSRIMSLSHFDHAFTEVLASSTAKSHAELQTWHKQYGGLKRSSERSEKKSFSPAKAYIKFMRKEDKNDKSVLS